MENNELKKTDIEDITVFDHEVTIEKIDNTISDIKSLSSDEKETVQALANMNVEIERMDHQLEAFMAETGAKLEKFKVQAPIMETMLDKASDRLDKITEKVLALSDDSTDEIKMKRQQQLMEQLNKANDNFNNMIMKLMNF